MIMRDAFLAIVVSMAVGGCAGLPRAPEGTHVEDSALELRLLAAGPWLDRAPLTVVLQTVLEVRGRQEVLTLYASQNRDGMRRVVGGSMLGATAFELQGTDGGEFQILRNPAGLPTKLLRDGLWHDATFVLPPQGVPAIYREADGSLAVSFPHADGRLEWLFGVDAAACHAVRMVVAGRIHWQAEVVGEAEPGVRPPRRWRLSHYGGIPYRSTITLAVAGSPAP